MKPMIPVSATHSPTPSEDARTTRLFRRPPFRPAAWADTSPSWNRSRSAAHRASTHSAGGSTMQATLRVDHWALLRLPMPHKLN
ncbi:hypothetical protein D3C80_1961260 [compost metagenome]